MCTVSLKIGRHRQELRLNSSFILQTQTQTGHVFSKENGGQNRLHYLNPWFLVYQLHEVEFAQVAC